MIFELLRTKWCRIIMKFRQKPYFETKTWEFQQKSWFGHVRTWKVLIWTCPDLKSRDLDMSRSEKSWCWNVRNWKFVIWTCLSITYFKTAEILLFFEILHLSIFYDKYLLQTIGNTFIFFRFYTFPFFISKFVNF